MAEISNDLTSLYNTYFPASSGGGSDSSGSDFVNTVANIGQSLGSSVGNQIQQITAASGGGGGGDSGLAALLAGAEGFAKKQLKQQLKIAKMDLDYKYKVLSAQTRSARQQLELDRWYKHQQINLLNKSHNLERDKFGLEQAKFQFQKDAFSQQQGLDILKFQASLGGPANFVQAANFARGINNDPTQLAAVQSLLGGANGRLFGPSGGQPAVQSLGSLASLYGGGSTAGSTTADQLANGGDLGTRLAQAQSLVQGAQQLGAQGGGALGAQALESLSPTEQGLLQSGFSQSGYDFNDYLKQYQNSRVGQGSAQAA